MGRGKARGSSAQPSVPPAPTPTPMPSLEHASALSVLFVSWLTPLVSLAFRQGLSADALPDLPDHDTAKHLSERFWAEWEKERARNAARGGGSGGGGWIGRLRPRGITRAVWGAFGWQWRRAFVFHVGFVVFQLVQPFVVRAMLAYLRDVQEEDGPGLGDGIAYACALGGSSLVSSLCLAQSFFHMRRMAVGIRTALTTAVYQHALHLTAASRLTSTTGKLTNLMAIDTEKIFMASMYTMFLWHAPVAYVLVLGFLFSIIGPPAIAGVALMACLFPVQTKLTKAIAKVRRETVRFTDERVKQMSEVLQAIRTVKMYAWEQPVTARVMAVRAMEKRAIKRSLVLKGYLRELMYMAPPLVALAMFVMSVYLMDETLSVSSVFTVLAFLNVLRVPSMLLSLVLASGREALVSLRRLDEYFSLDTLDVVRRQKTDRAHVVVSDAEFWWGSEEDNPAAFALRGINIDIRSPSLVAVVGSVGSGKTSLLKAMLGELHCTKGSFNVQGAVGYTAQQPWIQNRTLRDNVLFGCTLAGDEDKEGKAKEGKGEEGWGTRSRAVYERALSAAALGPDLSILPNGDLTEIGERGINLSGGQKARVAIARLLCQQEELDVCFLDDPFSALDSHTTNAIFHDAIKGELRAKLCVVTLNSNLHLLPHFDRVLVLDHGRVVGDGPFADVVKAHPHLAPSHSPVQSPSMPVPRAVPALPAAPEDAAAASLPLVGDGGGARGESQSARSSGSDGGVPPGEQRNGKADGPTPTMKELRAADVVTNKRTGKDKGKDKGNFGHSMAAMMRAPAQDNRHSLVKEDKALSGAVRLSVFAEYFAATFSSHARVGAAVFVGVVCMYAGAQVVRVMVDVFLGKWAEDKGDPHSTNAVVFIALTLGCLLVLVVRVTVMMKLAVRASTKIHDTVFERVLHAPVSDFFDVTTVGQIVNRFSKDMDSVDQQLPDFLNMFLQNFMYVLSIVVLCVLSSVWFALLLVPLTALFKYVHGRFRACSRDLKRLDSVTRSPMYTAFSETLNGLDTIRAFGLTPRFVAAHFVRVNHNARAFLSFWMCALWLMVRCEIISVAVVFGMALATVGLGGSINSTASAIALVWVLQLTALFQRTVQVAIEVETFMTSTERVLEYREVLQEAPHQRDEDKQLSAQWPCGALTFTNVVMRYRGGDPVLRGISFSIAAGERVGICGRTGAGKSSLAVALLRMVEIDNGSIWLDGVDLATLGLRKVRQSIAIIPQDPVLFSGTVRENLDPFSEYSDEQLWGALERVELTAKVRSLAGGLLEPVAEMGDNFSHGQRQLLCIARALLKQARVLLMDEATSSIDSNTDRLIQRMVRERLGKGVTVLTIAHRLQTIVDYDKVMVLADGKVVEMGSPAVLTKQGGSVFAQMLADARRSDK